MICSSSNGSHLARADDFVQCRVMRCSGMSDTCEVAIDCIRASHPAMNGRKATGPTARNMLLPTGTYLCFHMLLLADVHNPPRQTDAQLCPAK